MTQPSTNPWEDQKHGLGAAPTGVAGVTKLGAMHRALARAEATGHVSTAERIACFEDSPVEDIDGHSSVNLIRALRAASEAQDRLRKLDNALVSERLEQPVADFTEAGALEAKIEALQLLSEHLAGLQRSQPQLKARLQNIDIGAHALVEADAHDQFVELFPMIGQSLATTNDSIALMQKVAAMAETDYAAATAKLDCAEEVMELYQHLRETIARLSQASTPGM